MVAGLGAAPAAAPGLFEGAVAGGLRPAGPLRAAPAPVAMAISYLGDVALATAEARSDAGRAAPPAPRARRACRGRSSLIARRRSPVTALAVGLDYRGDAARRLGAERLDLPAGLRIGTASTPTERIAAGPPAPRTSRR